MLRGEVNVLAIMTDVSAVSNSVSNNKSMCEVSMSIPWDKYCLWTRVCLYVGSAVDVWGECVDVWVQMWMCAASMSICGFSC